jgi:thioredoxin-like negative regulator of GroEL
VGEYNEHAAGTFVSPVAFFALTRRSVLQRFIPVSMSRRGRWSAVAVLCLGTGVFAFVAGARWRSPQLPEGISPERYSRAVREFRRSQGRKPEMADVLYQLAMNEVDARDWKTADGCLAGIPQDHPRYGQPATFMRAQVLLQWNHLPDSEQLVHRFLDIQARSPSPWIAPEDCLEASHFLSLNLAWQLRFEERQRLLWSIVERQEGNLLDTLAACFPTLMEWYSVEGAQRIEEASAAFPHDVRLKAVLALYRLAQGRIDVARELVVCCRNAAPDDLRVLSAWLAVHHETVDWPALVTCVRQLPPPQEEDPWLLLRLRGQVHFHEGAYETAADCFRCVLARDPANAESHVGLARVCQALNRPEERSKHLAAAQALARIQNRLGWAAGQDAAAAPLIEIAELSRGIGLAKECRAVAEAGRRAFPDDGTLRKMAERPATESPKEHSE